MVETPEKLKPQLTPKEQIEHLKKKGVKFNYISEDEAIKYLSDNNNYFKFISASFIIRRFNPNF